MNPNAHPAGDLVRSPGKSAAPWSVLLAEDVAELRTLIAMWLEEAGHRVTPVSTGKEVAQQIGQGKFDLLVTDILMPDGDGWNAIAAVQQSRPQMRILAMSGGGREVPAGTALRAARAAGAIASLEKPFSRPAFLEAVTRVMVSKPRTSGA